MPRELGNHVILPLSIQLSPVANYLVRNYICGTAETPADATQNAHLTKSESTMRTTRKQVSSCSVFLLTGQSRTQTIRPQARRWRPSQLWTRRTTR